MKREKLFTRLLSVLFIAVLMISTVTVSSVSALTKQPYTKDTVPINTNANKVCKNFYQYLCNVGKSNSVLSGAFSWTFSGVDAIGVNNGENPENDYYKHIQNIFGVTPVIMGSLLKDEYIPVIAERYKHGAVPMLQVKIDSATANALEDVSDAVVNYDSTNPDRNMTIYNEYRANLEKLGNQLKTLENSGVNVYILRPWIEMNNTSEHGHWGKTDKGYAAFKNMWKQAVEYLTKEVGLTGVLFAYAPMGWDESRDFYPGNDYVDINAPTVYANSSDGGEVYHSDCKDYEWMRLEDRPFAFSETAARTGLGNWMIAPVGDYKVFIESVLGCFPEISFINLWFMDAMSLDPAVGSTTLGNYNGEYLIRHKQVINAEETVDYKNLKKIEPIKTAAFYTDEKAKEKAISLYEGSYSVSDFKNNGIQLNQIKSLDVMHGCAVLIYESKDCTGEANVYFGKTTNIGNIFEKANSIKIIKLNNIAENTAIWTDNGDQSIFRFNDGKLNRCVTDSTNEDDSLNITMDLGQEYTVGQLSIDHGSFYEDSIYNMRDFEVFVSTDDNAYKSVYKAVGNTLPVSDVYFTATTARYVRLKVITPNSSSSEIEKKRISIADISVYGTDEVLLEHNENPDDTNNNESEMNQSSNQENISEETGNSSSYFESTQQENSGFTDSNTNIQQDSELSGGYGDDDVTSPENDRDSDETMQDKDSNAGKLPEFVIPEFYNYVWLIICAGILLVAGTVWAVLLLLLRKKKNKK